MNQVAKFTDEQKHEIALEMLSGKLPHGEICRKYGISPAHAYRLKHRALQVLREKVGQPPGRTPSDPAHPIALFCLLSTVYIFRKTFLLYIQKSINQ